MTIIDQPVALKLSTSRKVAERITFKPSGGENTAKNTFALDPRHCCPGATEQCMGKPGEPPPCYAQHHLRPAVVELWAHNLQTLNGAYEGGGQRAVVELLAAVVQQAIDMHARLGHTLTSFRLHEAGDFFSLWYAKSWAKAIRLFPQIQFWVYTRSFRFVGPLVNIDNLAVYLSVDTDNATAAKRLLRRHPTLKVAVMAANREAGWNLMERVVGRRAPICPTTRPEGDPRKVHFYVETDNGAVGACQQCRLCIHGANNVVFCIH